MSKRIAFYANQRTMNQLKEIKERWEEAEADTGKKYSYSEIIKILIEYEIETYIEPYME